MLAYRDGVPLHGEGHREELVQRSWCKGPGRSGQGRNAGRRPASPARGGAEGRDQMGEGGPAVMGNTVDVTLGEMGSHWELWAP